MIRHPLAEIDARYAAPRGERRMWVLEVKEPGGAWEALSGCREQDQAERLQEMEEEDCEGALFRVVEYGPVRALAKVNP